MDSVMATVESSVHNAILPAIKHLVFLRVKLAMKSVKMSSGRYIESVKPYPHREFFSQNVESLQKTASSAINSNRDLTRIDETRGNITVVNFELHIRKNSYHKSYNNPKKDH